MSQLFPSFSFDHLQLFIPSICVLKFFGRVYYLGLDFVIRPCVNARRASAIKASSFYRLLKDRKEKVKFIVPQRKKDEDNGLLRRQQQQKAYRICLRDEL